MRFSFIKRRIYARTINNLLISFLPFWNVSFTFSYRNIYGNFQLNAKTEISVVFRFLHFDRRFLWVSFPVLCLHLYRYHTYKVQKILLIVRCITPLCYLLWISICLFEELSSMSLLFPMSARYSRSLTQNNEEMRNGNENWVDRENKITKRRWRVSWQEESRKHRRNTLSKSARTFLLGCQKSFVKIFWFIFSDVFGIFENLFFYLKLNPELSFPQLNCANKEAVSVC